MINETILFGTDAENISPPASVVSEYTVMSSVSQPHRPRQRKKRRAPVPPSGQCQELIDSNVTFKGEVNSSEYHK